MKLQKSGWGRKQKSGGVGDVSPGRIRILAGLVESSALLIVLDGSLGRGWRRALGAIPEFHVTQNFLDHGAVADQADDFEWAGAARTNQGIRLKPQSRPRQKREVIFFACRTAIFSVALPPISLR